MIAPLEKDKGRRVIALPLRPNEPHKKPLAGTIERLLYFEIDLKRAASVWVRWDDGSLSSCLPSALVYEQNTATLNPKPKP